MRLYILSDLHLEFRAYKWQPPSIVADLVILAGDIGKGVQGLEWAKEQWQDKFLYVPGNHEFYYGRLDKVWANLSKSGAKDLNHVQINGVHFLCCTLWTDFQLLGNQPLAMEIARQGINDFHVITCKSQDIYRKLWPIDTVHLHDEAVRWLYEKLSGLEGKIVVVTHHAPLQASTKLSQHKLAPAFVSDLSNLLFDRHIDLWVHGHTHEFCDYMFNNTRIVSNPLGYPGEGTGFKPDLIIEV